MLGNNSALFSRERVHQHFLGWFGEEGEWDFYQEGNLGCYSPTIQVTVRHLLGKPPYPHRSHVSPEPTNFPAVLHEA